MKSNHHYIAKQIFSVEHNLRKFDQSAQREMDIAPGMAIAKSEDGMVWHVIYHTDYDMYIKIVPAFYLGVHTIEEILKAQPWMCI